MNIFFKAYCRIFQTCFRLAMPFLPYREPKLLSSVKDIATEITAIKCSRPLIVTDNFLYGSGACENLKKALESHKISYEVFFDTHPNPTAKNVEDALKLYKSQNCDCLIAFGGGSSMDCAKALGARAVYPKRSLKSLGGLLKVFRKLPPLFAVPTTAGTGSEVTVTAVITDSDTKYKYTMNSFPFIPSHAVLDPEVTFTLPKHLTATTGMDALTHAVEAYIGGSVTKETKSLAESATKLIFENILTAYNEPENYEARKNMLTAAYKAGIAFSKSYVGYIHAVAHSLGGQYNIAHGLANSVLMPIVLKIYGKSVYKRLSKLAEVANLTKNGDSDETAAVRFIEAIEKLNSEMGIPKTLNGIQKEDIPQMASHASKEANPLYPVPVLMNAKELEKIYYEVGGLQ